MNPEHVDAAETQKTGLIPSVLVGEREVFQKNRINYFSPQHYRV